MQLIEEGKIHLHQPVAEIISEFDNNTHREITIFHILTHVITSYSIHYTKLYDAVAMKIEAILGQILYVELLL